MKSNRLLNDILYLSLPWVIILGIFFYNKQAVPGKEFSNFITWMKAHHYSEPIIHIYECNYRDPALKFIINDYLKIREGNLRIPNDSRPGYLAFKNSAVLPVTVVEVVPTDEGAKFEKVDPANLEKFRLYLQQRFGKKIAFTVQEILKNYRSEFGDIFHSYGSMFVPQTNQKLLDFVQQFNAPCIVKLNAQELDGKEVAEIAEIRHCTIIMGKKLELADDFKVLDMYGHEFGHIIGLDHQFIDPENLPRDSSALDEGLFRKNFNHHVGIDDVMIKFTPTINPAVGRYLSPLSRYVLEPNQGYEDDAQLGPDYNALFNEETLKDFEKTSCGGR